jgi:hypothetical protein
MFKYKYANTASALSANLGKTAALTVTLSDKESLTLHCTIVDARRVFDRLDYQVDYNGQLVWANSDRVALDANNQLCLNGSMEVQQ